MRNFASTRKCLFGREAERCFQLSADVVERLFLRAPLSLILSFFLSHFCRFPELREKRARVSEEGAISHELYNNVEFSPCSIFFVATKGTSRPSFEGDLAAASTFSVHSSMVCLKHFPSVRLSMLYFHSYFVWNLQIPAEKPNFDSGSSFSGYCWAFQGVPQVSIHYSVIAFSFLPWGRNSNLIIWEKGSFPRCQKSQ